MLHELDNFICQLANTSQVPDAPVVELRSTVDTIDAADGLIELVLESDQQRVADQLVEQLPCLRNDLFNRCRSLRSKCSPVKGDACEEPGITNGVSGAGIEALSVAGVGGSVTVPSIKAAGSAAGA